MKYRFAVLLPLLATFGATGCSHMCITNTDKGAVGGAIAGAAVGAVVAATTTVHTGPGMIVGAAAGAIVGAVIGGHMDGCGLREQLDAMTAERDSLVLKLKSANAEIASLKAEIARLNARIAELEAALAACQKNGQGNELARFVIGNHVLFASGKAQLSPAGMAVLDATAAEINDKYPAQSIVIEGHTDNVPIGRSGWADNWELGSARARVVVNYLSSHSNMESTHLAVMSYAFYKPVATNDTAEGRAQNRRTEIVVYAEK